MGPQHQHVQVITYFCYHRGEPRHILEREEDEQQVHRLQQGLP